MNDLPANQMFVTGSGCFVITHVMALILLCVLGAIVRYAYVLGQRDTRVDNIGYRPPRRWTRRP